MNNEVRFWEILANQKIVIPKIQRDYAQGRKGKEYIRRTFLAQIKNVLDDKNNNQELTLDFIYGNIENDSFRPLDGQQRLTTLWLIFWYLIFKSGNLKDEKSFLKNFSYNTRTSSSLFCENLCEKMDLLEFEQSKEKSIAEYIKSQQWFYSEQMQDPTISSMLRTISGDDIEECDNIQGVFKELESNKDKAKEYLELLKDKVAFYQLNIGSEELPVSDDLYIKMNARGKALTDFENFKADLIGWLRSEENKDDFQQKSPYGDSWEVFFTKRIDQKWTDMFWEYAKSTLGDRFCGKIDDIYFAFFNRYVVNLICVGSDKSPESDKNFNYIFGTGLGKRNSADDRNVKYEGFEAYKEYITLENLKKLDDIINRYIDNKAKIKEVLSEIRPENQEEEENESASTISFISQYEINRETYTLKKITLSERVYFYAICLFLAKIESFDDIKFSRWMRISKNIIENAEISSVSAMITCLKKINEIGNEIVSESEGIYDRLSKFAFDLNGLKSPTSLEFQIKEEIIKAQKVCNSEEWENKIRDAENKCFFNGSIRFLYSDKNGDINWSYFDDKLIKAESLFKKNPIDKNTIRAFLDLYNSFAEIQNLYLFTTIGFHRRYKNWKKDILCSNDKAMMEKVHNLLTGNTNNEPKNKDYESFVDNKIFETIVAKKENYKYRCREHYEGWAIHKEYSQDEGIIVSENFHSYFDDLRNYSNLGLIQIEGKNVPVKEYFWGMKIVFTYKNKTYCWKGSNEIFELKEDKEIPLKPWTNGEDLLNILNN